MFCVDADNNVVIIWQDRQHKEGDGRIGMDVGLQPIKVPSVLKRWCEWVKKASENTCKANFSLKNAVVRKVWYEDLAARYPFMT
jgi:hypothetical protein